MTPVLSLQDLSKYYTSGQTVVVGLDKVNLTFERGEFVAITGESGSGKSTLAHILSGVLPYEGGELLLGGRPTSHYDSGDWERYRRDGVSFISQSYGILPGSTVLSNVVSALRLAGMDRDRAGEEAEAILRRVELWELRSRRAAKLSSGQKQRLSIARALAKPAPILIADEPTGNLDPENSAKVISLLAEAAGDRLVILITHEFSEAADFVTRHISLHDGHVVQDSRLREAVPVSAEPARGGRPKALSGYIAALQLRARPVWSVLMLAFFALTVFAVFAFAGTFIANLDDTFTRNYDDSAFPNGSPERIVVVRADGGDMTAGDDAALLALDHVEGLEVWSYAADVGYAYRLNEDYTLRYSLSGSMTSDYTTRASVLLEQDRLSFVQTVPRYAGDGFLTDGRLPEHAHEVVAADPSLLGQTIPVYLQDTKNWGRNTYLHLEVTVVGVTEQGSGLYFHGDVGNILLCNAKYQTMYVPCEDLSGNEMRLEADTYAWYKRRYETEQFVLSLPDLNRYGEKGSSVELLCVGAHTSTGANVIEVSQEYFDLLTLNSRGDQVSLTLEDYAYADRVLEKIRSLGYAAVSPYQEGSTTVNAQRAQQRTQTLRICLIAFLAVLALQVVVLRSMFSLETETYRLLSNIGLDCRTAKRSLFLQVLLLAICGQIVGIAAVFLCGQLGVERVTGLLHYITLPMGVGLSLLHLGASLLTALWTMHGLKKQVYPLSGKAPDLDWNGYEEVGA